MHAIVSRFTSASILLVGVTVFCLADEETAKIDPISGLKIDAEENWKLIKPHCTQCHSERLLIQQQLDRKDWLKAIRRMQSKENLWDLGDVEPKILDYLSKYYGASENSRKHRVRRAQLQQVEPIDASQKELDSLTNENSSNSAEAESTAPEDLEEKEDATD